MGFMYAMGLCLNCKQPFSFNPERVPSLRVKFLPDGKAVADPNGIREPVCRHCMALANQKREANGLPPHAILPGAYDPEEVD